MFYRSMQQSIRYSCTKIYNHFNILTLGKTIGVALDTKMSENGLKEIRMGSFKF